MVRISVCIPTYNGEKYLYEQLKSILNQLSDNDEIIISDDSSDDGTIEIIECINDNRIKILKGAAFKSPIYNIENAIKEAKGDYIFLADQDDVWLENKIDLMLNNLKNYDLVVSDCFVVDENRNVINDSFYSIVNSKSGFIKNLIKNSYLGCCMAFNRKVLDFALPFPQKLPMHDMWIGLCSEIIGNPIFINHKLIEYRRHGENISFSSEKSKYSIFYKLKYRLRLFYLLMIRKIKNYYI